jgi:hypothetical protein
VTELGDTLGHDGRYINQRHVSMVGNTMTWYGHLMKLSRHGMNKVESGPLVRSSFEEVVDVMLDAAAFGEFDTVGGITTNILLGQLCPMGSGVMDVVERLEPDTPRPCGPCGPRVLCSRFKHRAAPGVRVIHSRVSYQVRLDAAPRVVQVLAMRPANEVEPAAKRPRHATTMVGALGPDARVDPPFLMSDDESDDSATPDCPAFVFGERSLTAVLGELRR